MAQPDGDLLEAIRARRKQLREDATHYSRIAGLQAGDDLKGVFYNLSRAMVRLIWLADEHEQAIRDS